MDSQLDGAALNACMVRLIERRAELQKRERPDLSLAQIANGDLGDRAKATVDYAGEISRRDTHVRDWRAVNAALAAIENGTYGICVRCDQPIPAMRLEFLPWAAACARCQERIERRALNQAGADDGWSFD